MQIFKLVCERDIFSVSNGTKGSTGLDFGTEPPCLKFGNGVRTGTELDTVLSFVS